MEKAVLTVFGRHESEKIIEKSRFLTYSAHVESEADARAFLSEVKALHPLATHCCYAFVADKAGNLQRFSDDGEPQGTAGIPILDVIKNKKLFETAAAVVRYFGGVKLGAGGLVRAYSSCTAENLGGRRKYEAWKCASNTALRWNIRGRTPRGNLFRLNPVPSFRAITARALPSASP